MHANRIRSKFNFGVVEKILTCIPTIIDYHLLTVMHIPEVANRSFLLRFTAITFLMCAYYFPLQAQFKIEHKLAKKISPEEEKAKDQTRWMYKNLSLDYDQYQKVNALNLAYAHNCDSIDAIKDKLPKNELKSKMRAERDALIKKTLTEQQFRQYILHKDKQSTQKKSPFTGDYSSH